MPYTWTSVIAGMETLGGSRDFVSLPVMDAVSSCSLIDTRSSKSKAQRWMTHSDISITSGQCEHTATHNTHNWLALRLVVSVAFQKPHIKGDSETALTSNGCARSAVIKKHSAKVFLSTRKPLQQGSVWLLNLAKVSQFNHSSIIHQPTTSSIE